jgi:hypothetical protein
MSNHHDIFEEKKEDTSIALRMELFNQSFINLMKTRDGRRFVWGLLAQTGFTGQPFTGQRETTDFNCGNRNTGIWVFALIDQFCPDTFSLMMREAREDLKHDHGNTSSSSGDGNSSPGEQFDSIAALTRPAAKFGYPE